MSKTINFPRPVNELTTPDAMDRFANPSADDTPITLIRPPIIFSASSYSTPLSVPIGLAYLTSVLEKANYSVNPIDCVSLGIKEIKTTEDGRFKVLGISVERLVQSIDRKTDLIGITAMFSQEWPFIRDIIFEIRKAFPKATIVLGGEHATALPEFSLRDCSAIDFVIRGEGELSFLEFCHLFRKKEKTHSIRGLAYLRDGKYVENGLSPRIGSLGGMPWPAWERFDLEPYFQPNFTMGISHGRNLAMIATRGCPYQCTFCSNPIMWTTRYVMRSPQDVVAEINHNVEKYGANSIEFYDLTAIVKKSWILEFAEELIKQNVKISWQLPSGTRSEVLDEEVIKRIAQAGLDFLVYAPESGSPRILKEIKKQVKLSHLTASIKTALKTGLVVKVNFIMGFPQERRVDAYQTLLYVWKLALVGVDDCNISLFSAYPGSELFDELHKKKLIKIEDRYFESLMGQFDINAAKTFCETIPPRELALYRMLGMGIFYAISYVRRPSRIFRLLRLIKNRLDDFQPRSLFEQRIFDFFVRRYAT